MANEFIAKNGLIAAGIKFPTTDGTVGQALTTNGSGVLSFATVSGGGTTALGGLTTDVLLTSPANTQVLKYNGTKWVNAAVAYGEVTGTPTIPTTTSQLTNNSGFLTANQSITLSGDFSGSGATVITGTLATVNSNVGSFGSGTVVPVLTVNGKGLVTAVSTSTITPAGIGAVATSAVGANSGVASLDSGGKVPTSQLPSSVTGAMSYQGVWNASTNSPTLTSGTGTKGYLYKVSVAGSTTIDTISSWAVGDMVVFNGTAWDKIDGALSEVVSVAGRTGAVTLAVADVSGAAPLASPTFTGTAAATTPATSDNSTTLATTAFVKSQNYVTSSGSVASATNVAGGSANQVHYQTGSGTTGFMAAPSVASTYLQWNGSAFTWAAVSGGGTSLSGLTTDVLLTSPVNTQVLKYNGTKWVNSAVAYGEVTGTPTLATVATSGSYTDLTNKPTIPTTIAALTGDVTITSPSTNQMLQFNGTKWVNATVAAGGGTALSGLTTDVLLTSPVSTQVLKYNGTKWVNAAVAYGEVTGTPTLATVATSGSYTDLTSKPTIPTASSATPVVNGTATVGTDAGFAHGDHVHPTDSSRAPLASPTFTGTPAAPTPITSDNSTTLATTAYVKAQSYVTSSGSVASATNVASGASNQVIYQTGSGATGFITAPSTASTYLQWNGSAFTWAAASGGGGTSLSGLTTDVNISSPSNNQLLQYNSASGKWVNATVSGGGGLTRYEVQWTYSTSTPGTFVVPSGWSAVYTSGTTSVDITIPSGLGTLYGGTFWGSTTVGGTRYSARSGGSVSKLEQDGLTIYLTAATTPGNFGTVSNGSVKIELIFG